MSAPPAPAPASPSSILSTLINHRIRLTLSPPSSSPKVLEGTLYAYDAISGTVVLSPASGTYRLVKPRLVSAVEVLGPAQAQGEKEKEEEKAWDAPLRPLDPRAKEARLREAVRREEEKARRIGVGVTPFGQNLFDALAKTLPVRWNRASIVVLDEVTIAPPYNLEDCRIPPNAGPNAASGLKRVRKVLEGERARILARTSGSPTPPIALG